MKRALLIILIIFSFSDFSFPQNYSYYYDCNLFIPAAKYNNSNKIANNPIIWEYIQTPITNQITDIFFPLPFAYATHTGMGIIISTNSGLNWLEISFNDTTFTTLFNGIHFVNSLTGWVVGGAMQIRKTTNGGFNWVRQIPPPVSGVLNSVYFFNSNTGIAIGRKTASFNSCIIRTTNGGLNWQEIVASTSNENELFGQFWLDANTGFICGKNFLMKSTNGGLNFINYFPNIPPTSNGVNALLCIYFNGNTGWIGGSNIDHKNIYKTTNFGLNWVFQNNPVVQFPYSQINDIIFIDNNTGWAVHGTPTTGAILVTYNGGTNWEIEENTNVWFDCLYNWNDSKIYCGSSEGKIWYRGIPSNIKKIGTEIPDDFKLYQNYPNPFNQSTNIMFDCVKGGFVQLKIYNIIGEEILTLINELKSEGRYNINFNSFRLSSGIYFYEIIIKDKNIYFSDVKKMVLIK